LNDFKLAWILSAVPALPICFAPRACSDRGNMKIHTLKTSVRRIFEFATYLRTSSLSGADAVLVLVLVLVLEVSVWLVSAVLVG